LREYILACPAAKDSRGWRYHQIEASTEYLLDNDADLAVEKHEEAALLLRLLPTPHTKIIQAVTQSLKDSVEFLDKVYPTVDRRRTG
jgi:hypothetical protein